MTKEKQDSVDHVENMRNALKIDLDKLQKELNIVRIKDQQIVQQILRIEGAILALEQLQQQTKESNQG
jgi:hypothetical protein